MKKIFSCLCSIVLILTVFTITGFAAEVGQNPSNNELDYQAGDSSIKALPDIETFAEFYYAIDNDSILVVSLSGYYNRVERYAFFSDLNYSCFGTCDELSFRDMVSGDTAVLFVYKNGLLARVFVYEITYNGNISETN